jgi:ribosomal protein L7/L12
MDVRVLELIAKNQKIEAIKFVREQTQMGLKEAKDYVERLER